MNRRFILRASLCLLPWLASCSGVFIYAPEFFHSLAERRRGAVPETEWNAPGVWRRVADNPPSYIPNGYPLNAPRGEEHGTWVVDLRDGKRLFAPKTKVRDLEPGVLLGEARKVTRPPPVGGVYLPGEY